MSPASTEKRTCLILERKACHLPTSSAGKRISSLVSKPVVGALPHMLRDVAFSLALSLSSEAAPFDKHGFLAGKKKSSSKLSLEKRSQQQLKNSSILHETYKQIHYIAPQSLCQNTGYNPKKSISNQSSWLDMWLEK